MTERTPAKLSLVIPLYNEKGFLSQNSAILENLKKLSEHHNVDLFFCEGGDSDDSCEFIRTFFLNANFDLRRVFFIQEVNVSASVGRSVSLAIKKQHELGDYICVCPIDVLMSTSALENWFQKIPHSKIQYGAFFKFYEKVPGSALSAFFLDFQRFYLNYGRLKILRKFVWTNAPFFKKHLFLKLISRDRGGFLEDVLMAQELRRKLKRSSFHVISENISVSSRRYLKRGVLKQMVLNFVILLGFRLGVSQRRLKAIYR